MYPILCMFTLALHTYFAIIIITHCSSTCVTVLKEQLFAYYYYIIGFILLNLYTSVYCCFYGNGTIINDHMFHANGGTTQVSQAGLAAELVCLMIRVIHHSSAVLPDQTARLEAERARMEERLKMLKRVMSVEKSQRG